jgi:hypothetical protein
MQIFIRLSTGKTITMDVTNGTLLSDVLQYANEYDTVNQYHNLLLIKDYYEENSNLTVEKNKILKLDIALISLYKDNIIKEIILIAC